MLKITIDFSVFTIDWLLMVKKHFFFTKDDRAFSALELKCGIICSRF